MLNAHKSLPPDEPYMPYAKGIVNPGESFHSENDGKTWTDWSATVGEINPKEAAQGLAFYDYDNFALKAYADPVASNAAIVPDLGNMTETDAVVALEKAGFAAKAGNPAYSDTVAAGFVMGQDIAAGTEKEKGSTITYLVSLGSPIPPIDPEVSSTDRQSGLKTPLASTGDNTTGVVGMVALGALLACGTFVAARKRLRASKAYHK